MLPKLVSMVRAVFVTTPALLLILFATFLFAAPAYAFSNISMATKWQHYEGVFELLEKRGLTSDIENWDDFRTYPQNGTLDTNGFDVSDVPLQAGVNILLGICDDYCHGLDLIAYDGDGEKIIAQSSSGSDSPLLRIELGEPKTLTIGAQMGYCQYGKLCDYAVAVFRE